MSKYVLQMWDDGTEEWDDSLFEVADNATLADFWTAADRLSGGAWGLKYRVVERVATEVVAPRPAAVWEYGKTYVAGAVPTGSRYTVTYVDEDGYALVKSYSTNNRYAMAPQERKNYTEVKA